ncbi:MAG: MerR family transcriptional regulator [Lutisporaceae bacterium]
MDNKLRVNDVAMKFGISKRTIKYYEEIGILKSYREEGSNYRIYDQASLDRLEKILILRRLNFTINDICQILASDNKRAQEIFQDKLESIRDEINALTSLQSIVKSFLDMSNSVGIDNVNIYQLLSEQIYIHKKVERVINMSKYEGDILKVEIGILLIPYVSSIIDSIKSLRSKLNEELKVEIPLVRLADNVLISDSGYRILFKNNVIVDKKLDEKSISEEIIDLANDLKDVIRYNVKELVG